MQFHLHRGFVCHSSPTGLSNLVGYGAGSLAHDLHLKAGLNRQPGPVVGVLTLR